jgi:hypothetical protein
LAIAKAGRANAATKSDAINRRNFIFSLLQFLESGNATPTLISSIMAANPWPRLDNSKFSENILISPGKHPKELLCASLCGGFSPKSGEKIRH